MTQEVKARLWTERDVAELTRLWKDPKKLGSEIARRLKRTRNSVYGKALRLGLMSRAKDIRFRRGKDML